MVMSVSVIRYTLSSKGTSITLNQQLGKNSRQEKKKEKKVTLFVALLNITWARLALFVLHG